MKVLKDIKFYLISISALIIGGAILAHGILYFVAKQNELKLEKEKVDVEATMRTQDYYKQGDLEKCLKEAKDDFDRKFSLNSVEGTTPGGQEARKWNNDEIASETKDQYNKDREFCLKLYK